MNRLNVSYDHSQSRNSQRMKQNFDDQMRGRFTDLKEKLSEDFCLLKLRNLNTKAPAKRTTRYEEGQEVSVLAGHDKFDNLFEKQPRKRRIFVVPILEKQECGRIISHRDGTPQQKKTDFTNLFEITPRIQMKPSQEIHKRKENVFPLVIANKQILNPIPQRKHYLRYSLGYDRDLGEDLHRSPKIQRLDKVQPYQEIEGLKKEVSHRILTSNNSSLSDIDPEGFVTCKPIIEAGDPRLRRVVERNLLRASQDISKIKEKFRQGENVKFLFADNRY